MIKKLAVYLREYRLPAILAPITIIGEVIMEILIPMLMAQIINIGLPAGDIGYVVKTGGLMVLLALLSLAFGALSGRFASVAGAGFAKNLRNALFGKVQDFSFANIDKFSTASLITRLTTDVTGVQNTLQMMLRIMFRAPVMLISAAFMATRINGRLALVFAVAGPIIIAGAVLVMTQAFPRFQAMLKKYDLLNASIQENLTAIRVVKAFVRTDHETEKFRKAADDVRRAQIRAEKVMVFAMPCMQLVMNGCMIAVCWFGGLMIIGEEMLAGDLMSFFTYVSQVLSSIMMIAMISVSLVMSRASASRIIEVLEERPDVADPAAPLTEVEDGSVVFDHVNFSYAKDPNNLILEDVVLNIKAGETIGIIGGTGSAKTTLVQLIPRLYDVLSGSVLVGGHDVREYSMEALRDSVAMVLQKNVLFSGSIKENLRWGKEDATDEELIAVCKTADAHDFISSFPNGYDTDLGQGGVNLSGGQKQRLCIARALLKDPKILILDDSTSAVDTATDSRIRAGFATRFGHVTTFIIAQRIASVQEADRILVMDDGKVSDIGTHEELLARSEIYREVYESQRKGAEE
ncbi:MAG: ABC transporter ATP-binding protein [Clostridiales bacterium]|nr:ABC transporter ATP-binding protein [Clostridiales bacterium]